MEPGSIGARELRAWLADGGELALVDVREAGQFGERHLLLAAPVPYSRLELRLPALVPNRSARLVLCDEGDGVAARAARRAQALGYRNIFVLDGGVAAWERAGFTLYAGVFVPSKAFGELIEIARHTPHISAEELAAMQRDGADMVIVDGRPYDEFRRAAIPGGICCPNGELALRIGEIAPDPKTTIVVNCAGRTRSIIGAQTLIDFGVPNRVVALENGTQGWTLAGLEAARGSSARYPDRQPADLAARRERARALAEARGARFVGVGEVERWRGEAERTTYLFDVRTAEEFGADGNDAFIHAPGGQLIQASDQWIATRGARIVVADGELVRAPVVAAWLRQLGHDAHVLDGGIAAAGALARQAPARDALPALAAIAPEEAERLIRDGAAMILDLRASESYRAGHIDGARWATRPRLATLHIPRDRTIILAADEAGITELAAVDLGEAGARDIRRLAGDVDEWRRAGLGIVASPDDPPDGERIDFLFFTAGRLTGDLEASRQYLAWETGLVGQLDEAERAVFRISAPPAP